MLGEAVEDFVNQTVTRDGDNSVVVQRDGLDIIECMSVALGFWQCLHEVNVVGGFQRYLTDNGYITARSKEEGLDNLSEYIHAFTLSQRSNEQLVMM